jgi:hypothetical protein
MALRAKSGSGHGFPWVLGAYVLADEGVAKVCSI